MADTIKIQLENIYKPITEEQIRTAKNFVLRRESAANGLRSLVDALMEDAADEITRICYRYGVEPTAFTISPDYNPDMFKEIANVMDMLEDEILDLLEDYSLKCTKDEKKKAPLILWILALGRNNKGLRASLEQRLRTFLRDIEAMIAAARKAGFGTDKAVRLIRSKLHTAYQMPGMAAAFKNHSLFKARNIRYKGVKKENRGESNSEANNIDRFVKTTVQMAWMHYQYELYEEKGAAGYYVLRGSTYPCDLCDSKVGFHQIDDIDGYPPFHPNCCCFAVPVYEKDINDLTI